MRCKTELEKLTAYMNDFVATLPASTRADVGNQASACINNIAAVLTEKNSKPVTKPQSRKAGK